MQAGPIPVSRALFDASPSVVRPFEPLFSATSRERGLEYAAQGRVTLAGANHQGLLAEVQGTQTYVVELAQRGGTLEATCDCPHFSDSAVPCKHIWATLLVAGAEKALPPLGEMRALTFRFGETTKRAPAAARMPQRQPARAPTWRDILSRATAEVIPGAPSRREIRYVVDPEQTRTAGQLVILPMESATKRPGGAWRGARLSRPYAQHAELEDAVLLGLMDALSPLSSYYSLAAEFRLPIASSREVLQRLCASGRARLGDPQGPPLAWDAQPYTLVLEGRPDEHLDGLSMRAWLERADERVAAREPALVLAGGLVLWRDRAAPLDDGGQFAWLAAERGSGPAVLPAPDVADFLEAMHRAPRMPRLRLPPEHEWPEAQLTGQPYALLHTGRDPFSTGIAVEAGVDYDGVRAPLETSGRAIVDRARRRLVLRDGAAEQVARAQLEQAGIRPLGRWPRLDSEASVSWRLAATRLEPAVRALVDDGWRVEVDGKLRRAGGEFAIEVSTGIDWLEANVRVTFGGAEAPLPELLAALEEKRRAVTLADGSVGELSDASLEKLRRWAGMADTNDGTLRFRKAQTALVAALFEGETQASFDEPFSRARAELEAFDGIAARPAPRTFRGKLRDYQQHALGWFAALRRLGFGGCLADDMGLGKTVQVLAMLDGRRREKPAPGPSLVVAPRSVLANWASEASRFAPRLRVLVHDGADRQSPGSHFGDYDLVLTTYGLMRQDAVALSRVDFDYVILDEAQAIKTARTESSKAARALRGRYRLAMTGTPLENHLGELASLLDFLNPGVLGTASSLAALGQGSRRVDAATGEILSRAVRPFFLRRTKRQVAPELPERVEQTVVCDLSAEQRRLYDELLAHYRQSVSDRVARDGVARSTAHILEALLRLRQAACHPGLINPSRRGEPSAKLDTLVARLETLREEGQKALVFSQFTSLLAIVRDRLDDRGIVYEYLDGATRDRPERVARFQSDERCGVFLLSLKAGGVGLNLTAAEYVFVLDPWWNPAVEAQAIDRAHRIGQTKSVFAYKLLARETVEEKVAQLQAQKRELADALFGEGGAALSGLTREDLAALLA